VPKYHVTGGPSGDSGVEVGGKSYEVGDSFESSAKDLKWLVDGGYLSTKALKKKADTAETEKDSDD
tara:strand:+ start:553 stop:750 length:198 start_codon:yes stop_codon:yes gene_type:complete